MTDPQLYIFTPGRADMAITDGAVYRLASGTELPAADAAALLAAPRGIARVARTSDVTASQPS